MKNCCCREGIKNNPHLQWRDNKKGYTNVQYCLIAMLPFRCDENPYEFKITSHIKLLIPVSIRCKTSKIYNSPYLRFKQNPSDCISPAINAISHRCVLSYNDLICCYCALMCKNNLNSNYIRKNSRTSSINTMKTGSQRKSTTH